MFDIFDPDFIFIFKKVYFFQHIIITIVNILCAVDLL